MQTKRLAPDDLPKFIKELRTKGTYGELAIRFRHGEIVSIALTETYLADTTSGRNPTIERDTQP
jgi:hypothetical protein